MAIYRPGDIVAERYRVSEALSQGGMGAVYLAEQLSLGRRVALKVILAHQESDTLRARFDAEARAVCQLHHPNIIIYHDYGHDAQGRAFLVMEFLAGFPGTELVYGATIPTLEDCVHVIGQLASALHEAHSRGIIHRDLKWSNAMIVPQSHDALFTKLIDFGILKVAMDGSSGDQRQELTRTGVLLGTPQYMSPEAICGKAIDGRADLYSLAVMTYEILTGRRPFDAEGRLELLRQHVQDAPPPMEDVGPDRTRHRELEAVVLRGLAKRPHDRFDSVLTFHSALCEAIGLERPALAGARTPTRRTRARESGTPVASPGGGHVAIAGRTDPRADAWVPPTRTATPPAPRMSAARTPPGAPIDTAADTGARRRPSRGGWRVPSWARWAVGGALLSAIGFGSVVLVAGALGGPDEVVQVTTAAADAPADAPAAQPAAQPDDRPAAAPGAVEPEGEARGSGNGAESASADELAGEPEAAGEPVATGEPVAAGEPVANEPAGEPIEATPRAPPERPATSRTAAASRTGRLTVSAAPYAEVRIAGEPAGTTPIRARTVRAGRVTVTLTHPTFGTQTRQVTVRPDATTTLTVNMRE